MPTSTPSFVPIPISIKSNALCAARHSSHRMFLIAIGFEHFHPRAEIAFAGTNTGSRKIYRDICRDTIFNCRDICRVKPRFAATNTGTSRICRVIYRDKIRVRGTMTDNPRKCCKCYRSSDLEFCHKCSLFILLSSPCRKRESNTQKAMRCAEALTVASRM